MKIIAFSTLIIIFFTGCVSTQNIPLDDSKITSLKPESILVTHRDRADFAAMTAGKAMFALIGAAAMIAEGNRIVRENSVTDPADFISDELIRSLSEKYALKVVSSNETVQSSQTVNILKSYDNSDWILDVETINWGFTYFPTDWNNYRVMYSAKLRLIDSRNREIIAEGFCSRVPDETENAPSYDQLLINDAAIIKSELKIAASLCINEFKTKVFKI